MINLLRGEFYKLFRSKCLYICCVAVAVFVVMMYGMFCLTDAVQKGTMENGSFGVTVSYDGSEEAASIWDDMGITTMGPFFFSSIGGIIVTIFAAVFVFGEYANGAIKNVVGKGYKRGTVFAAKYMVTAVGAVVIELVMMITFLLCEATILKADRLNAEVFAELCEYAGIQFILGAALSGIIVLLNQICRNLGGGIAIGVGVIMFSNFITTGLNAVLAYFKINVNVSDYWVVDLISTSPASGMDSEMVIRVIASAIVWFVVALGAGIVHFGKVDVK